MCDNEIIVKWGKVPYRLHGKDIHGVDCVGIVYGPLRDVGIFLPGSRIPKTDVAALFNIIKGEFHIVRDGIRPYDLLLYRLSGGTILHCGVAVGDDTFLHVLGHDGVKQESVTHWGPQLIKAYRYRERRCQL